jgi:hypothetical protein
MNMNNARFRFAMVLSGLFLMTGLAAPTLAQQESWHEEPAQYCKLNEDYECVNIDVSKFDEVCGGPESDDECYDVTPPPVSAIRLDQDWRSSAAPSRVRPEHWPFRVMYIGRDILEFDEKGNIVSVSGRIWDNAYMVEMYYTADRKPMWQDERYRVYYIFSPDTGYPGHSNIYNGFVVSHDFKHICPAVKIADGYSSYRQQGRYHYLRGDCAQEHPIESNGHIFWTYPRENYAGWVVQRFEDPKAPIYNLRGECQLYCNEHSRQK